MGGRQTEPGKKRRKRERTDGKQERKKRMRERKKKEKGEKKIRKRIEKGGKSNSKGNKVGEIYRGERSSNIERKKHEKRNCRKEGKTGGRA